MNIGIVPIFVLLLLLGLGLLVAFLIVLFKAGSVGRWILFGLLVFPILLVLLLSFHRPVVRPVMNTYPPMAVFGVPNQVSIEDNVFWQENLEEELIPDTYSSLPRAAYGLGSQIHETIEDALEQPLEEIQILERSDLSVDVMNRLREGLKTQFENAKIFFYTPRNPGEILREGQVRIALSIEEEDGPVVKIGKTSYMKVNQKGTLEGKVITQEGHYYKTVSYDTRSWLWDYESFQSETGKHDILVSISDETATSYEEARDQALGKAAEKLSLQVRNVNPVSLAFTGITKEDLMQKGIIADEYSQKLAGMAGPIWRHAVLLDVSPERLQSLITEKTHVVQMQRASWARSILSLGGMILLVCIVYVFANAATKGYYSTVLAITAVLAAAILGIVILNYA